MKNKIVDFIMYNIIPVAMILIVLMMLIPLPVIAVESLIGIEALFSVAILIYSFTKNRVAMPNLVLMFSLFSMALNISLTRISLTGYESGISVPLAGIISSTIGGKNYIIGGIISVILLTVQVFIISRGCCRVSEVNARFTLNSMNQKFFDIDNKLNQGIIDKREEEILKENVRKEIDYYSSMEGASKFLSGISKANVFFTLVNLAGGILIQVVKLKTSIGIAIENSMFITVGNTVLFTLPVMVVSFAAGLNITGDLKLVKAEYKKPLSSKELIEINKNEFTLEISSTLIPLVDSENDAPLLSKILEIRKEIPNLPKIIIVDNMGLKENEYYIHWKETELRNIVESGNLTDENTAQIISDIKKVFDQGKNDENTI